MLSNYVSGYPGIGKCLIDSAVTMSPPVDLVKVSTSMYVDWNYIYGLFT